MFNLIEPKLQKVLESILKHNKKNFMNLLDLEEGDELFKASIDFFEWVVMDSELLKEEFRQNKLDENSDQVDMLCKNILGYDMIASEIVRIASVFGLNEKFKDQEA